MEYTKTLAPTGLGLALATQFLILGIAVVCATLAIAMIHWTWRHNKSIGQ